MARGDGRVYQRGRKWWIQYYAPDPTTGKRKLQREPGGDTEAEARKVLKGRLKEVVVAEAGFRPFQGARHERITVGEILDGLVREYEIQELKSTNKVRSRVWRIKSYCMSGRAALGSMQAIALTADLIQEYKSNRKADGRKPATINRELEILRRAFNLAVDDKLISMTPKIRMIPVRNARKGFFDATEFYKVLEGIGDADVVDFLEWFFWTGMRPGGIKGLTFTDLDTETWALRLHASDDKTGAGISIPLTGVYREIIERRIAARRLDCRYIFHRNGRMMGTFYKRWRRACTEIGISGKVPYDLRRTAARNMLRAAVPEAVVMSIAGWKTRSMMDRYNISSELDKIDAQRRTQEYVAGLRSKRKVLPLRRKG